MQKHSSAPSSLTAFPLHSSPHPMVTSIAKISSGRDLYYINHYYVDELSEGGKFLGTGAKEFGIEGEVISRKDQRLKNLFMGLSPDTSEVIRQGGKSTRTYTDKATGTLKVYKPVLGFDFTISDPKGVSALHAIGTDEIKREVMAAREKALSQSLSYIEEHLYTRTKQRVGKKQTMFFHKAKGTFAVFQHALSRELDPQLHYHAVLINAGKREDGKGYGAIDGQRLWELRYTAGMVYLNALRHELERGPLSLKTFDIPFKEEKGASFGIEGIPVTLTREWSKRSQQIEDNITPDMSGRQVQSVVLKTRKPKEQNVDVETLKKEWAEDAKRHKVKLSLVTPLARRKKKPTRPKKAPPTPSTSQMNVGIAYALRDKDHFKTHHVMTAALKNSRGALSTEDAKLVAARFIAGYTRTNDVGKIRLSSTGYMKAAEHNKLREEPKLVTYTKALLKWHQVQRQRVKARQFDKFQSRALGLYLRGRISRVQYLAIKKNSPLAHQPFKVKLYHAMGLISTKQRNYLLKRNQLLKDPLFNIRQAQKDGLITKHQAKVLRSLEKQQTRKVRSQGRKRILTRTYNSSGGAPA